MPAERFLFALSQFQNAAQSLRALAGLVPGQDHLLAQIDNLLLEARRPITLAISGPPGSGKSVLLERLFGSDIGGAKPRRSGAVTRVIKHQTLKPEEHLPPGVEEFFLSLPALQHFQIVDLAGVEESVGDLAELHHNILPLADVVLFCFRAEDPWHPPSWALIQSLKRGVLRRALFVLTSQSLGSDPQHEAQLRYFRQTGAKKFGFEPEVVAVELSDKDANALDPLLEVLNRKISGSHPHVLAFQEVIARTEKVAGEMEKALRTELDSIRTDEHRVLDFERRLMAQHSWLRLELDQAVAQLLTLANPALERASELVAKETSLSRLHNIFARRNHTSQDLQEGVCEALRKLVLPKLESITTTLEHQLHERWEPLSEVPNSRVVPIMKDALALGPRTEEARRLCMTRLELHLSSMITSTEAVKEAGRLISRACVAMLEPIVILVAAILAGLFAAFQAGCELAGGAIVAAGGFAAIWSFFSGWNIRRVFAQQYKQSLTYRIEKAVRLLKEEVRLFGSSLLDDLGRRLGEGSAKLDEVRAKLEPALLEAGRLKMVFAEQAKGLPDPV